MRWAELDAPPAGPTSAEIGEQVAAAQARQAAREAGAGAPLNADLAGEARVETPSMAEALAFRGEDGGGGFTG